MRWAIVAGCAFVLAGESLADDWPAFRGPKGNGLSEESIAPTEWSTDKNIKWKATLPMEGNGSPIVSNGSVFVACAEDRKGLRRSLFCFDRSTGEQNWVQTVDYDKEMPTHKTNLYCGSTPVANGERVVVWHSSAGLYCYDFQGRELWSRDLGQFEHMWGYGSSPVLLDDRIILNCGPGKRTFVTALELATGKTLWEQDEPFKGDGDRNENGKYMGSWSTPVVAKIDDRVQILCAMPTRLNSYDPDNGDIIWTCDGIRGPKGDLSYSSPMVSGEHCVVIGGFNGPAMALKLGGQGNVTATNRLWRNDKSPQSIGTGVFVGNYVYRSNASRPSIVECIDPRSGEVIWTGPPGGSSWSSIIGTKQHLYLTDQDGATIVFKANPSEFVQVASNKLGEPTNSTIAISDGEIFLRTFRHLYCISSGGG